MEIAFFKPEPTGTITTAKKAVIPPPHRMTIELETITPDAAAQILSGNTDNRPCRNRHVKFLADQMKAGAWQVTGDPIKISSTGRLLDGQHRLQAIVQSDTTQQVYVARNCEDEIFSVIDTGVNRSAGDVLATAGQKNHTNTASAAKLLIMHEKGILGNMNGKQRPATNAAILDYVLTHDMADSVTRALTYCRRCKMLNVSEWGALDYLLSRVDAKQANDFLSQISTGLKLTEGHPVFLLRQKLQAARDGRFNFTPAERMALTIKAWNAVRDNKKLGQLTWKNYEEFPEIL